MMISRAGAGSAALLAAVGNKSHHPSKFFSLNVLGIRFHHLAWKTRQPGLTERKKNELLYDDMKPVAWFLRSQSTSGTGMERRKWAISLKPARFAGLFFLRLRNSSLFVMCFVSGTRIGSRHRRTHKKKVIEYRR